MIKNLEENGTKGKINARKYNFSLIAKKFLELYKKLLT